MEYTEFIRKPFVVEAVEITEENITELASLVGEIDYTDSGRPFIRVDKSLVPNISRVYPGYYLTRYRDKIHCWSPAVFEEQFAEVDDNIKAWVDYLGNGS